MQILETMTVRAIQGYLIFILAAIAIRPCDAFQVQGNQRRARLFSNTRCSSASIDVDDAGPNGFDTVVSSRYACTRFHRHDGTTSDPEDLMASLSNSDVVESSKECLDVSRRSPSGFNAQPYKLLMIHSQSKKEALAKYCIGRNSDRVRDSDCTVVFLSDKECLRSYKQFSQFLDDNGTRTKKNAPDKWTKRKIQAFILLFSSGWPLPRLIANPISFSMRTVISCVSVVTRRKILVPSLGSADTWASKNTMLVAMTFMLACTSRGLASCPMEGYNVGGIRKALGIPRRYSIPIIVSVGTPFIRDEEGMDDIGMEHGAGLTNRYPKDDVILDDSFS